MKITLVCPAILPVFTYGGIERVVWCLGKELAKMGHSVTFLAKKGSSSNFGAIKNIDENIELVHQIPPDTDIVHLHGDPGNLNILKKPYCITMHGNTRHCNPLDVNTIFVSRNQANRFGSGCFIHNGLDWSEYTPPDFNRQRTYFHFIGKAAWRVKNVRGAIAIVKRTSREHLKVIGGHRLNIKMGFQLTLSPRIRFHGMVGGSRKEALLNGSKGLIFPVRWHEPFGLAIIESLFYGCPVLGTPYGSLPELVPPEVGFLSNKADELTESIKNIHQYSNRYCNDYANEHFNSKKMAQSYLEKYLMVLNAEPLNTPPPRQTMIPERFLEWLE